MVYCIVGSPLLLADSVTQKPRLFGCVCMSACGASRPGLTISLIPLALGHGEGNGGVHSHCPCRSSPLFRRTGTNKAQPTATTTIVDLSSVAGKGLSASALQTCLYRKCAE